MAGARASGRPVAGWTATEPDRAAGRNTGSGWRGFAARRAAKARSSPTSSPIFLKNLPNGGGFGCLPESVRCAHAIAAGGGHTRAPREVELDSHWLHKGGIVLHFAGVDSISAAEELAGLIVADSASGARGAGRGRGLHRRPDRLRAGGCGRRGAGDGRRD